MLIRDVVKNRRAYLLAPFFVLSLTLFAHGAPTLRQTAPTQQQTLRHAGTGASDETGSVSFDLPASGEVRVENGRGGIEIEVWDEKYLAVAASVAEGRAPRNSSPRKSPLRIERSERLLVIDVARVTAANAPGVDISLRVPRRARLKVFTTGGAIDVRGVPAYLAAQTVTGEIRLGLAPATDAQINAHSLRGAVRLADGFDSNGSAGRVLRQKFQMRLGAGASIVSLFSGRGEITLAALAARGGRRRRLGALVLKMSRARRDLQSRRWCRRRLCRPRSESQRDASRTTRRACPTVSKRDAPEVVDDDEVVRVDSRLVTLNVSVVNRASGRGLTGLTQDDFRLFEDDAEQQIAQFESAAAPFDLLLLIDLSGSTAKVTDLIRAAALRFVNATRPQDRVGVVTFAGGANIVSPLTTDRRALREKIAVMERPGGDTRLYDAVGFTMEQFGEQASGSRRRAIVLMSDGMDSTLPNVTGTGSTLAYEELRARVQEHDAVFYALWVNTEHYEALSPLDIQPETFDLAHDRMSQLSEAGGGVFYEVERLEDLAGAYERVVEDLGTVYSLSYQPTNKQRDGAWRNIRVRLPRHTEAVARGKRGYFAR